MKSITAKRVCFQTVGCRLNQYETEKMAADLAPFGFERVKRAETADLYIINTCTVTHKADKDCRYLARKAKRENPEARVVLVGCYVETDPEGIGGLEDVDLVIRNSDKGRLTELLPPEFPDLFSEPQPDRDSNLTDFYHRNRAWIKISDGCNQTCSYCLVTIVRGDLQCRPAMQIVDEIRDLVAAGYNEVVLTAVNMGMFEDKSCSPAIKSLADLCKLILDHTDVYRLRLSSIEPQTVTDELIDLYAEAGKRICRHWHIPLQSGSDRILKQMRRPYNRERFLEKCAALKEVRPGTIIGSDLIAGFPGETESDFGDSVDMAGRPELDYLHVFSYSDREGTAAAALNDKIPPYTVKERATQLTRLSDARLAEAHQRQVGETLEVISEFKRQSDGFHHGISDNYLRVRLPRDLDGGRNVIAVRITGVVDDGLLGEVVGPRSADSE